MRCPDCGNVLTELQTEGHGLHRCFKCGGFWTDSGTANTLTLQQLTQWRRISSMNPVWGWGGGKDLCPVDMTRLNKYSGDLVPPNISVKRCDRCGKWWFPADSLFTYKSAAEAKVNYFQKWGMISNVRGLILPIMTLFMMAAGTVLSVRMVMQKQQSDIIASAGISEMAVTYTGYGRGLMVFKTNRPVMAVSYQMSGSLIWHQAPAEIINGYEVVKFADLKEGAHYIISLSGKEYGFMAK